jgi:predicted DNA binding CopG/RHH family protein
MTLSILGHNILFTFSTNYLVVMTFIYLYVMTDKRIVLQIRIKEDLKERAVKAAEKKGLDLSNYVRMVLTEAVERDSK